MEPKVEKQIEDFFQVFRVQEYDKNQILLSPGDKPKEIIQLVSGHLRQYDISNQGDKVIVNVFKKPAFIPMSWAINRTINQYYYETIDRVTLRRAPVEKVVHFVRTNPEVSFDLLRRIYLGTDVVLRRMAHAMGGTARTRIMYELLLEARRFGKKQLVANYQNSCLLYTSDAADD